VPPLPLRPETYFNKKSIEKRRKYIERFMKAVIRTEEFCTFPYLFEFIKINHSDFKSFSKILKSEEDRHSK
jgi:hypothetical protein